MPKRKGDEKLSAIESPMDKKAKVASTAANSEGKPTTDDKVNATATLSDSDFKQATNGTSRPTLSQPYPGSKSATNNNPKPTSVETTKQMQIKSFKPDPPKTKQSRFRQTKLRQYKSRRTKSRQTKPKQTKPKRPTFLTLPLELRQQIIFECLIADLGNIKDFLEEFIDRRLGELVNEESDGDILCMAEEEYHGSMNHRADMLRRAYPQLEAEIVHPLEKSKCFLALDEDAIAAFAERWRDETGDDYFLETYYPYSVEAKRKRRREARERGERGDDESDEEDDESMDDDESLGNDELRDDDELAEIESPEFES